MVLGLKPKKKIFFFVVLFGIYKFLYDRRSIYDHFFQLGCHFILEIFCDSFAFFQYILFSLQKMKREPAMAEMK